MTPSVIPSLRYSEFGSPLALENGSTATELMRVWARLPKYKTVAARTAITNAKAIPPINLGRRDQREDASGIVAAVRDSVSRFIRLRSAQRSAACWQRTSRSFSSALLMTSSTLGGRSGFNLVAGAG